MFEGDVRRLLATVGIATTIGLASGELLLCYLAATLLHLAWLYRNLLRLLTWLRNRSTLDAPESPGLFEEITLEIDYLRERHRKRKKTLASYLRQFQQATRALPDATIVLGEDGEVQWANEASARYLGIRWPEDMGQRITNLIRHPTVREFVLAKRTESALEIPSPISPHRFLSILLAPYGESRWLFVARDITELHRANLVRSDFVANVSHELRTPITVFRGYLELLYEQRDMAPPPWLPALEQLNAHANRMQELVEELLLLSRLEQSDRVSDPEPVLVSEMLADILKQARIVSGAREHLFTLETDATLRILGSASELKSCFTNLVVNAVNYTPARGVIRVRWFADARGAHLEVQDNGIGIAEEHLDRLTERFYRVDSARARGDGGTGLGLAIVKHVLIRHSGTLDIRSQLGAGSTFRCDFPPEAIVPQSSLPLSRPA